MLMFCFVVVFGGGGGGGGGCAASTAMRLDLVFCEIAILICIFYLRVTTQHVPL